MGTMAGALRIALITDIHFGPTPVGETKLGLDGLPVLDGAVRVDDFAPARFEDRPPEPRPVVVVASYARIGRHREE